MSALRVGMGSIKFYTKLAQAKCVHKEGHQLINSNTHFSFCKNIVYKNIEPQVLGYFKNIFIPEIV